MRTHPMFPSAVGFLRKSFVLCVLAMSLAAQDAISFDVSYSKDAFAGPFTGRVVLYFAKGKSQREPRLGSNWFNPPPMLAIDVKDLPAGKSITVGGAGTIRFPRDLTAFEKGAWNVQAVFDRNLGGRAIGSAAGNLKSDAVAFDVGGDGAARATVKANAVITARPFKETNRVKELVVPSAKLTAHYGRPTSVKAAVALPEDYDPSSSRRWPVIYEIPGFGGRYGAWSGNETPRGTQRDGESFIHVLLDPECPGGHHVFADSANNGPWGTALVTEFIPAFEAAYKAHPAPEGRFLTGHSSGGWSSLYLQVTHPKVFGGTWSTSPDPVDFRDFQRIDLTSAKPNMFDDPEGNVRPLARQGNRVMVTYRAFSDMERPLRGEQLESFEYVFSPKGADGAPMRLWNRDTGEVDTKVAASWKPYDIGLTLRTRWKDLAPDLAGKIRVIMGNDDTFYLEGACKLLKNDLEAMGADASVQMLPGDHGSVLTKAVRDGINKGMADAWRKVRTNKAPNP